VDEPSVRELPMALPGPRVAGGSVDAPVRNVEAGAVTTNTPRE